MNESDAHMAAPRPTLSPNRTYQVSKIQPLNAKELETLTIIARHSPQQTEQLLGGSRKDLAGLRCGVPVIRISPPHHRVSNTTRRRALLDWLNQAIPLLRVV